jgi:hypothetical protein
VLVDQTKHSTAAKCHSKLQDTSECFPDPWLPVVLENKLDKYRRSGATINSPSLCIALSLGHEA